MTTRIPPTPLTGVLGHIATIMTRKKLGRTPESLGVMWHHRKVLRATMSFSQRIQRLDRCDDGLKSLAHMAVAVHVGCSWCLDFNYFMAHNKGLDLRKAREVPRWELSEVFTPLERAVMAYAVATSNTPPTVTDDMVGHLLDQLGPEALLELTAVIGCANLTTRTNVAMGIESDGFAQACGLEPLAEPVGSTT